MTIGSFSQSSSPSQPGSSSAHTGRLPHCVPRERRRRPPSIPVAWIRSRARRPVCHDTNRFLVDARRRPAERIPRPTLLGQAFARRRAKRATSTTTYAPRRRPPRTSNQPEYVQASSVAGAGAVLACTSSSKALATARPIVDKPSGVQALATVGDAYLALGDYARRDPRTQAHGRADPGPTAGSRLLAAVRGDNEQAIA